MRFLLVFLPLCAAWGQENGTEFFEKKIRPVLATRCYGCHSSKLKSPMGELVLDTKAGLSKAVKGRLLTAIRFADPQLQTFWRVSFQPAACQFNHSFVKVEGAHLARHLGHQGELVAHVINREVDEAKRVANLVRDASGNATHQR